ncbi:hypothetical protein [Streptomyces sp. NBC_01180]|uniref:hypothetical protein n=1 Tax=Streptomyces sp. NBC_01180 TaxID=2903763 RepID=UPI003869EE9E|nr:hypothetical protein OG708_17640 [Streptomyces sp. NBC_01180]
MTETTTAPDAEQAPALDPAALKAAITRKATLTALSDAIKAELATVNTEVQWQLEQHAKATGSTKYDAPLPDGTKVGSITLTGGERAAKITDDAAFMAWVRETYPTEATVQIVKAVRTTFTTRVLAEMTAAGVSQIADPETGEVHDVPGVEIRPSRARSNRLTFSRATKAQPLTGRELVAAAYQAGELAGVMQAAIRPSADQ